MPSPKRRPRNKTSTIGTNENTNTGKGIASNLSNPSNIGSLRWSSGLLSKDVIAAKTSFQFEPDEIKKSYNGINLPIHQCSCYLTQEILLLNSAILLKYLALDSYKVSFVINNYWK